eukprot:CAMPEP_0175656782 /NCGR_PEP_ID=MMETSP0097-20121207/12583_1 /TAXON_ID=311494 /ORGANISM="Alexandrium monilatum, Strain CCMP3105" /LENGTH=63 /DNA_ID=CAMNT_0016962859 /DNA_START=253 /DNA_END=444 /DNA_ORIENTATION=+
MPGLAADVGAARQARVRETPGPLGAQPVAIVAAARQLRGGILRGGSNASMNVSACAQAWLPCA